MVVESRDSTVSTTVLAGQDARRVVHTNACGTGGGAGAGRNDWSTVGQIGLRTSRRWRDCGLGYRGLETKQQPGDEDEEESEGRWHRGLLCYGPWNRNEEATDGGERPQVFARLCHFQHWELLPHFAPGIGAIEGSQTNRSAIATICGCRYVLLALSRRLFVGTDQRCVPGRDSDGGCVIRHERTCPAPSFNSI